MSTRLFSIERSTNANYVCYDLNLNDDGAIDPEKPIHAYWVMAAQDGHREELTGLEKSFAYGFSTRRDLNGNLILTTQALSSQPILISITDGEAKAETEVNGHRILLKKAFAKAGGGLFPHVDYIRLTGSDMSSGAGVEMTLHP
jgi:hypothetical protein